jgi:hypothetical protein
MYQIHFEIMASFTSAASDWNVIFIISYVVLKVQMSLSFHTLDLVISVPLFLINKSDSDVCHHLLSVHWYTTSHVHIIITSELVDKQIRK